MTEKMNVESLNIGMPKEEVFQGRTLRTGILKTPVKASVRLGLLGFEGDGVGNTKHHGGSDKAVCVYSLDHYPFWEKTLDTKLTPPAFGENLTISGLKEEEVCIGDILQIGTALVQVSQPRQPCATLAALHNRSDFVKLVNDSGRTGFYLRILEEGIVEPGDLMTPKEKDTQGISVAFANTVFHHDKTNREGIERVLDVPALSLSWRKSFQRLKNAIS